MLFAAAASDRKNEEHQREIVPRGIDKRNCAYAETTRNTSRGLTLFAAGVVILTFMYYLFLRAVEFKITKK